MEEKRARILELVEQLNHAAAVYYQGRDEVMSNYESVSYTHLTLPTNSLV